MFLKYLFEFFLVIRVSGTIVSMISWHLMLQDKYCFNIYNQTDEFCQQINAIADNDTNANVRDHVLASAARYNQYFSIIEFIPMFIWSLFVGSFLDKNAYATRLILLLHIFGELLQNIIFGLNEYFFELSPYFLLFAALPLFLSGGMATFFTVSYRFVTIVSSAENRPVRLMLVQFGAVAGASLGVFAGGILLRPTDLSQPHSEIRKYHLNFLTSAGIDLTSILLLLLALKFNPLPAGNDKKEEKGSEKQEEEGEKKKSFIGSLLDKENIRSTMKCLFQSRPDRINFSIWSVNIVYFLLYFVFVGTETVTLQFVQKVYGWDAAKYSNVIAIYRIVMTLTVSFSVFVFIKKLKIDDTKLVTCAIVITGVAYMVVGLFLRETVYFVSMPFLSIGGLGFVCLRNKLSAIVDSTEVGKIFSVLSTIESSVPLLSSIAYSNIFAAVIFTNAGLLYQFSGLLYGTALIIVIVEQIVCRRAFFASCFGDSYSL